MNKRLALSIIALFAMMSSAIGLTTYGDAQILKGDLTIIRDGRALSFTQADQKVDVVVGDVLRVGKESRVILNTVENTKVRMGSHAVFQVKPWKQRKKTGYLRMAYGKMRFATKKLQGQRRFRIKTATATIGVKGTEGEVDVASNGATSAAGIEGRFALEGRQGQPVDINPGTFSLVVGGQAAPPAPAPKVRRTRQGQDEQGAEEPQEEGQDEQAGAEPQEEGDQPAAEGEEPGEPQERAGRDQGEPEPGMEQPAAPEEQEPAGDMDLDKAPPMALESESLEVEEVAVEIGMIGQEELEASKETEISADTSLDQELEQEEQTQEFDEQQQDDAEVDPEFEQDLQESEDAVEIAAVEPDVPSGTPDIGIGEDDGGLGDEPAAGEPEEAPVEEPVVEPETPEVEVEIDTDNLKGVGRLKPVFPNS